LNSIIHGPANDYFIGGYQYNSASSVQEIWIARTDNTLNVIEEHVFHGAYDTMGYSIAAGSDFKYGIVGFVDTNNDDGMLYIEHFNICGPGTYKESGICNNCPYGTNNTIIDAQECAPCPPGFYQDEEGKSFCISCGAGMVVEDEESESCHLCLSGSYQKGDDHTKCYDCPAGSYQDVDGKTSCKPCPPGFVAPNDGYGACTKCPDGTFQNEPGKTQCFQCNIKCKTCNGPSNFDCLECNNDQIPNLTTNPLEGCVCKKGYYEFQAAAKDALPQCKMCDDFCDQCEGPSKCLKCSENMNGLVYKGGKCYCEMNGAFEFTDPISGKKVCGMCHPLCTTCFGINNDQCYTCSASKNAFIASINTCKCKDGYYYDNLTKNCDKCNELCSKCVGPLSTECVECNTKIGFNVEGKSNTCVYQCDSGYYRDPGFICKSIFFNKLKM